MHRPIVSPFNTDEDSKRFYDAVIYHEAPKELIQIIGKLKDENKVNRIKMAFAVGYVLGQREAERSHAKGTPILDEWDLMD